MSTHKHIDGVLDLDSDSGKGTVIEYVVLVTMGDCVKTKFNSNYDLDSSRLGKINVKSSKLCVSRKKQCWNFYINPKGFVPDYYVCVALDELYSKILHVWEIPNMFKIPNDCKITITNSNMGLKRFNLYEVDASDYDDILQEMDITEYPEFRNLNKDDIKKIQYEPYDSFVEPPVMYFDRCTGEISDTQGEYSLELKNNFCFPLFDHNKRYTGYINNDVFTDFRHELYINFIKKYISD